MVNCDAGCLFLLLHKDTRGLFKDMSPMKSISVFGH